MRYEHEQAVTLCITQSTAHLLPDLRPANCRLDRNRKVALLPWSKHRQALPEKIDIIWHAAGSRVLFYEIVTIAIWRDSARPGM
jgi:hypothetical protein